ncbi:MAG: hypothetical protein RR183_07115 [Bacteroidales bacterium]
MDNINFLKTRLASMDSFYRDIQQRHYDFMITEEFVFTKCQHAKRRDREPFNPGFIARFFREHGFQTININGELILIRNIKGQMIDGLAEINSAYELFDKEFFEEHKDKLLSEEVLKLLYYNDINE